MNPFRVMVSPLTKTAYAGRVKKDEKGYVSAGPRHDVTQDVLVAVIDIVGPGNTHVLSLNGVPHFEIEVRDVRPKNVPETTKKRYLYTASVKGAEGSQTFFVDAESREEADAIVAAGETHGIYTSDVEVQSLDDLEFSGETEVTDNGDY